MSTLKVRLAIWKQRVRRIAQKIIMVIPFEVMRLSLCAVVAFAMAFVVTGIAYGLEMLVIDLNWPLVIGVVALNLAWERLCDETGDSGENHSND